MTDKKNEMDIKSHKKTENNKDKKVKKPSKIKTTTKQKIVRLLISVLLILALLALIIAPLYFSGLLSKIDSAESLKQIMLENKQWSYAIFVLIQFLQVTFIPLPAMITTLAGVQVFGPTVTFILSLIAVMAGSLFAFWLGRKFGRKLIVWIIGHDDAKKWGDKIEKGKYTFFLMMLFPGFPDDILCILAGATPMSYKFFTITNLITRPVVFASICFIGSGAIIPYTGWGLPIWIAFGIFAIYAFYYSIKHSDKIEKFFDKLVFKFKNVFGEEVVFTSVKDNYKEEPVVKSNKLTNDKGQTIIKDIDGKILTDINDNNVLKDKELDKNKGENNIKNNK